MPKEKIFSKLKYKDYNNILEQVLEKKDFSVMGKNLILSILYKMETNYNDYETVKRDVAEKEEIIENFIDIVKNDCDSLVVIKPESKRSGLLSKSKYIGNIEKKHLEVFANEKYMLEGLYSLYHNEKMVDDKYGILKDAITEIFQKGNASNNIELLRDFNGYSWYITPSEFEDVYSNLVFQDIRIIAGDELLKNWIHNKDDKKDYIQELRKELNRRYDKEMSEQLFNQIIITILKIYLERYPKKVKEIKQNKKVEEPQNMKEYIEKVSTQKKKLLKEVDNIDRCINDPDILKKELATRKKAGKEIKGTTELKEILNIERKKCMDKILEYNKTLDPRQFIKQVKASKTVKLFDYKSIAKSDTTAFEELINLQKIFLKAYKILAEKLSGKKEVLELIYEFRYYNLIPITNEELIKDNEELKEDVENMRAFLIEKAREERIINSVNSNKYINKEILKKIFSLRIINLENTEVNMQNIQGGIRVNYLDGDLEETSKDIMITKDIGKYKVKEKKKIKIFS